MGWNASHIVERIIESAKTNFRSDDREDFYDDLIEVFTDADWDTIDEVLGLDPAFDRVARSKFPEIVEEPDEDDEEE